MWLNIGFTFGCLGKKRPQNVTLHGLVTKTQQGTIIGAMLVAQNTGVGDAYVEGFPTKSPTYDSRYSDATSGHYKCLS